MVERQVERRRPRRPGGVGCVVASPDRVLACADDRRMASVMVRPRGSRPGSPKNPIGSTAPGMSSPVSSFSSRRAPASTGSSMSRKPPGMAHLPANGSCLRRISRTRSDSSKEREDDEVHRDHRPRVVVAEGGWHRHSAFGRMKSLESTGILASRRGDEQPTHRAAALDRGRPGRPRGCPTWSWH